MRSFSKIILVAFVLWAKMCFGDSWQPIKLPIETRWAALVDPNNPLPDYPRPQMVRPDWLNLNGLWDYAITPTNVPSKFDGQILVPFPVESALSGVGHQLSADEVLWYRRHFIVPAAWTGQRVLLHFGAVDWDARVFVNGRKVGEHKGGYDVFTFDITTELNSTNEQELMLAVTDPTEADQPRGKQSHKPEGIFYTQSSGIWQTVWLEPAPKVSIAALKITPDLDGKLVRIRADTASLERGFEIEAVARDGVKEVSRIRGAVNSELALAIESPVPWTPEHPFLYDLTVTLKSGDREIDHVTSYFGLRKIAIAKDTGGAMRIALDGQPLFQTGVLDQGFWPEGICTAPTDEAMRHDLEFVKKAGFNLVRKHVKIEPERWYYWCDKLGLLVWQDMPSANNNTTAGRTEFEAELQAMIGDLHNHPSIIQWVLFNEGWGQYDTEHLVEWIKQADPSRLVDNASGWTDTQIGDVVDAHSYPEPDAPTTENLRASVIGEFGGLGLVIPDHAWSQPWAYQMLTDTPGLQGWYSHLMHEARRQEKDRGLCAVVFTQLTDVENECNGLLTYDRAVAKMPPEMLAAINHGDTEVPRWRALLTNALFGNSRWFYTFKQPPDDWRQIGFHTNSDWREGEAGFGTAFTRGSQVRTVWDSPDIWIRKTFTLPDDDLSHAKLLLHHDKDTEIYLNGVLAFSARSYLVDYALYDISAEAAATLKPGTNTIAAHCHQTAGGQFIDVGIVVPK